MNVLTSLAKVVILVAVVIAASQARYSLMLILLSFLSMLTTDVAWVRRLPSPNTDLRLVYAERPPELARLEALRRGPAS